MKPIKYVTSLLTFYLKGEISAEQNLIKFKNPNTILGLIPLGSKKENITINQIASTQSNFKLKLKKFILGIIFAIFSFSLLGVEGGFIGFSIMLIIAVNFVLDAFEIVLQINMTSGQTRTIEFFIFDKAKAQSAENQINAMIAERLDDTNNRKQTDKIVYAINNK